jgi:hypothetical protein
MRMMKLFTESEIKRVILEIHDHHPSNIEKTFPDRSAFREI